MTNYAELRPTIAIAYISDEDLKEPIEFVRHENGELMLFVDRESAEKYLVDTCCGGDYNCEFPLGIMPIPAYVDLDYLLE